MENISINENLIKQLNKPIKLTHSLIRSITSVFTFNKTSLIQAKNVLKFSQEPIEIVIDEPCFIFGKITFLLKYFIEFTDAKDWEFKEETYLKDKLETIKESLNTMIEEIVYINFNISYPKRSQT